MCFGFIDKALVYAVLAVLKSPDLRAENPNKFHASAWLGFSAKILFLSYNDLPEEKVTNKKENFRSSIIDREGDILAKSVRITNLGIDP